MALESERVLSIQSHVAYGYVGGKAAVFPLQCLGYDVDVINTVNLSNHSGYGYFGGTKATAAELNSIFESMEANQLLMPRRLLTGYIPGAEALSVVASRARQLKEEKPEIIYLLDPVMGDAGRLYVAADVVPVYRSMLPLATIITPNWFEVETLTNIELKNLSALRQALTILHDQYHVPNIVITSIPLRPWLLEALPLTIRPSADDDYLLCISSSSSTPGLPTVHAQCVPLIPGYFSGVGDLFSALVLAHFPRSRPANDTTMNGTTTQTQLSTATSEALTKTHAVLQLTHDYSKTLPEEDRQPSDDEKDAAIPLRKVKRMRGRELRLVQGQDIIRGTSTVDTRHMEPWTGFWEI